MTAYYSHCSSLLGIAREARDRAIATIANQPEARPGDVTVAIILAAAAAEGFINEVAEMCHPTFLGMMRLSNVPSKVSAFGTAIREIENSRGSTLFKYLIASYLLDGKMLEQGANPYQDLKELFGLRDMLLHLKLIDQEGPSEYGIPTIIIPKKFKTLEARGLAKSVENIGVSWFNSIQTEEMAKWACDTSENIMQHILTMIPDFPGDPTGGFKFLLKRRLN